MTFPNNYARFFRLLAQLPKGEGITAEELRHSLVAQYSNGRTTSLRELTPSEYTTLCSALEQQLGLREQLRKQRSKTLKLMQGLGIDTTHWPRINAFCQDPRICGKPFARVDVQEHELLQRKLRAMARKGGLRKRAQPKTTATTIIYTFNGSTLPN